jgi:hypothetical protein
VGTTILFGSPDGIHVPPGDHRPFRGRTPDVPC